MVSGKNWGADIDTKLTLYRALICPKIDYGCSLIDQLNNLQMLELIQNQALHICLNAFKNSPKESLHVEANEQPSH